MTSFLQSSEWAEFQRNVGREVFRVGETNVIKHQLPFGKNYLYIPHGPSGIMTNDEFRMTNELARREKAIFIKAEPIEDIVAQGLVRAGFQKSTKNIQPHKTVVLDLTQSEDELLSHMHHKTRYNIRVAEKHGIEIRPSEDINIFWHLMQKTSKRDQFSSHSREYYEKLMQLCTLYIAYKDEKPLAAAMVLTHGDRAYYLHGASDHEYRAMMAPYMLHWSISTKLQASNIKSYDFWGIDSKRWPGFTRFKLGWGGRTVEYPGAFDLVLSPGWFLAYRMVQYIK